MREASDEDEAPQKLNLESAGTAGKGDDNKSEAEGGSPVSSRGDSAGEKTAKAGSEASSERAESGEEYVPKARGEGEGR
jgi:hypothetical protein